MKQHTLLKRATAAALLSATIVTPAVVGLTAGAASALPIESPNCGGILQARDSSIWMASVAYEQGDKKAYAEYMADARRANANYQRHCL